MRFSVRRACGVLAVAAVLAVSGVEAVPVVAGSPPQAITAKHCKRGTPAVINGKSKCLQPGEYCNARYNRQYRRYGFVCRNGRLRYR